LDFLGDKRVTKKGKTLGRVTGKTLNKRRRGPTSKYRWRPKKDCNGEAASDIWPRIGREPRNACLEVGEKLEGFGC